MLGFPCASAGETSTKKSTARRETLLPKAIDFEVIKLLKQLVDLYPQIDWLTTVLSNISVAEHNVTLDPDRRRHKPLETMTGTSAQGIGCRRLHRISRGELPKESGEPRRPGS